MRIKSERDFWSGLMFIVVGVIFAVGATNYSMGPACPPNDPCAANLWARLSQLSAHPGAGYFPLGLVDHPRDPRRDRPVQVADDREPKAATRSARSPGGR